MSQLKGTTVEYLTRCFYPIRITASVKCWKQMGQYYSNPLFRINKSINFTPNSTGYSKEQLKRWIDRNLSFIHATPTNQGYQYNLMFHTISNLLNTFGDSTGDINTLVPIYDDHLKEDSLVTVDSMGKIPERWIKMLADFHIPNATLDYDSKVSQNEVANYWTSQLKEIPETTLANSLFQSARAMDTKLLSLQVENAPPYTEAQYKDFKSKTGLSDESVDLQELSSKIWRTANSNDLSIGTRMFYQKCKQLHSFYPPGEIASINPCKSSSPVMGPLFACEGGIELYYFRNMPWYSFHPYIFPTSRYYEIRGVDQYYTYKGVSFEELIVISEALRIEGAKFSLTRDM